MATLNEESANSCRTVPVRLPSTFETPLLKKCDPKDNLGAKRGEKKIANVTFKANQINFCGLRRTVLFFSSVLTQCSRCPQTGRPLMLGLQRLGLGLALAAECLWRWTQITGRRVDCAHISLFSWSCKDKNRRSESGVNDNDMIISFCDIAFFFLR